MPSPSDCCYRSLLHCFRLAHCDWWANMAVETNWAQQKSNHSKQWYPCPIWWSSSVRAWCLYGTPPQDSGREVTWTFWVPVIAGHSSDFQLLQCGIQERKVREERRRNLREFPQLNILVSTWRLIDLNWSRPFRCGYVSPTDGLLSKTWFNKQQNVRKS